MVSTPLRKAGIARRMLASTLAPWYVIQKLSAQPDFRGLRSKASTDIVRVGVVPLLPPVKTHLLSDVKCDRSSGGCDSSG
jgi:hypothetical protein